MKFTGSLDTVHLFISNLRDIVTHRKGVLAIPIKKGTFSDKEVAILTQELTSIDYCEDQD